MAGSFDAANAALNKDLESALEKHGVAVRKTFVRHPCFGS